MKYRKICLSSLKDVHKIYFYYFRSCLFAFLFCHLFNLDIKLSEKQCVGWSMRPFDVTAIQNFIQFSVKLYWEEWTLTRHYNRRPFDETVCDAIIANGVVKNRQKRCKTFAMAEPSNTVKILVACAMQGTQLIHSNCLWWGRTIEMGSHINVCAIYGIQFAPMNRLLLGSAT